MNHPLYEVTSNHCTHKHAHLEHGEHAHKEAAHPPATPPLPDAAAIPFSLLRLSVSARLSIASVLIALIWGLVLHALQS